MKKVLSLTAIMIILLIALTGCVDVNYEVTLNRDGTADVAYVYGFDKATLQQMGTTAEEMTRDMKQNAELSEYTVEVYSDDDMEGFKAKKHIENLSEISLEEVFGTENVKDSEENQFKIEKKGLKTLYSQNAKIDLSSMDETTASMVTMKYTVKLPTAVGANNADEVSKDKKTLTWNLTAGEVNEISFKATELNMVIKIIAIVVLVLLIIGIIIVVIKSVKKHKKEKDNKKDEPSEVIENNEEVSTKTEEIEEKNKNDEAEEKQEDTESKENSQE